MSLGGLFGIGTFTISVYVHTVRRWAKVGMQLKMVVKRTIDNCFKIRPDIRS